MPLVGVRAGLSIDHLVDVKLGARFDVLGGPGLYAALGAHLVDDTTVRLAAALPGCDARFRKVLDAAGIDLTCSQDVPDVARVWILNGHRGRRVIDADRSDLELETTPPAASEDELDPPDAARFVEGLDGLLSSSPTHQQEGRVPVVGIDPHQLLLAAEGIGYLGRVAPPGAVLLPSRLQLALLGADVRDCAWRIASELDRPVVARLDRDGMYVTDGRAAWSVRDRAVQVRETTGAGDASAGAVIAALGAGADLPTSAAFGASVARLAISDWGHAGLLRSQPLHEPFNQIDITKEIHR